MRLLIEEANELESEILEEINEATGQSQKNYYIKGTFSTPDKKNRNGRVYSSKIWENNVETYQKHIKENSKYTLGELEHPSRVDPDPMLAVMKIVELKMENGLVLGKAKILNDNSKETNKLKALIDEGYKIGVSSRGTGRMKGSIVEEFQLSTYDIVQSPSDYNAMLSGITESTEKNVIMNESTGHYVCTDEGCSLSEPIESADTLDTLDTLDTPETPCQIKAEALIEALNTFSKETVVLTKSEKIALELTGLDESLFTQAMVHPDNLTDKTPENIDEAITGFLTAMLAVQRAMKKTKGRTRGELQDVLEWLSKEGNVPLGESDLKDLKEARQYNGKEIMKQSDKAFDEMGELIYMVSQSDSEMAKRMGALLNDMEQTFDETGITAKSTFTEEELESLKENRIDKAIDSFHKGSAILRKELKGDQDILDIVDDHLAGIEDAVDDLVN